METKCLRLECSSGKIENMYNLILDVPSKTELLDLIGRPPFYIFSKQETKFSSGILAQIPHAIKLRIAREYQEPFIGVFIQLTPKSEELVEILDIKGVFVHPPNSNLSNPSNPSLQRNSSNVGNNSISNCIPNHPPIENGHDRNINPYHRANAYNPYPLPLNPFARNHVRVIESHEYDQLLEDGYQEYNEFLIANNQALIFPVLGSNNNGPPARNANESSSATKDPNLSQGKRIPFNFFKTHNQQVGLALSNFDYYESRCQWPDVSTKLHVTIRLAKTNYSVIVSDEDESQIEKSFVGGFNAEPFYLSDNFSDVKIKVGSTIIPAHKIILSGRSQYFATMFSTQMRETVEGIVQIDDVEEPLIKKLIAFIYTGKVENIENCGTELFILADKYDMEELACYCEKYLLEHLTIHNAIEMYDISQTVGRKGGLAKRSKEIIMWNKDKFAGDLNTFKEFSLKYPDLIFELLKL